MKGDWEKDSEMCSRCKILLTPELLAHNHTKWSNISYDDILKILRLCIGALYRACHFTKYPPIYSINHLLLPLEMYFASYSASLATPEVKNCVKIILSFKGLPNIYFCMFQIKYCVILKWNAGGFNFFASTLMLRPNVQHLFHDIQRTFSEPMQT